MTILVASQFASLEFAYARLLGAKSARALASAATEDQLQAFPATAWCRSQEANTVAWERISRSTAWAQLRDTTAAALALRAEALERLAAQMFMMTWGRRLASLRICLSTVEGPVALVSDLPRPLLAALAAEYTSTVVEHKVLSLPLRFTLAVRNCGRLFGRHAVRCLRLLKLRSLPSVATPKPYVSWLGALPSEMAQGADRFSVVEFLDEGRQSVPGLEVVVQGAVPDKPLPPGMMHRPHIPALRTRPELKAILTALRSQILEATRDLVRCLDFRSTTLLAQVKFDVPAYRLWFDQDRPSAILYPNHQIGGESAASLLKDHAPTAMVFYSANVAYRPCNINAPRTSLEPEMRYIVADRLTMWSDEMSGGFRSAGYDASRLPVTGPIFFGRQGEFAHSREGDRTATIRIGIFDVAVLRPAARFRAGYGLLTYDRDNQQRFFSDIFSAVGDRFGDRAVIVRKGKRAHHPDFEHDLEFSRFASIPIEEHQPNENLWRVLETVDLVLCMPFTSVAYFANECGIPAAYYDPRAETQSSPLGGRVLLLLGRESLDQWLCAPDRPSTRVPSCVASAVIAAASGTPAAIHSSIAGRKLENVVHT